VKSQGAKAYAASPKGVKRGSQPKTKPIPPLEYGRASFRLTARRNRGTGGNLPALTLDDVVTDFDWTRAGAVMTGNLTFVDPALRRLPGLVVKGDVVRCDARSAPGAPWRPLWEMTVVTALRDIGLRSTVVQLTSTLAPAQSTKAAWHFREDHAHPSGWTADQVARHAAKRMGIVLGNISVGRHHITKLVNKSASALEIITAAYQQDRASTGRRFDVSTGRGVLDVTEVRRPRYMLMLGRSLTAAIVSQAISPKFASAVVVTSTAKAAGSTGRRKIRVLVVDRARVRRYGYIRREISKSGLSSHADARRYGEEWLARVAHPWDQVSLTHAGIPWVQRGDGVRLDFPEESLAGDVYLLNATHTVSSGSYTMQFDATVTDLSAADARVGRVAKKKAAVARTRRRKTHAKPKKVAPAKAKTRGLA